MTNAHAPLSSSSTTMSLTPFSSLPLRSSSSNTSLSHHFNAYHLPKMPSHNSPPSPSKALSSGCLRCAWICCCFVNPATGVAGRDEGT